MNGHNVFLRIRQLVPDAIVLLEVLINIVIVKVDVIVVVARVVMVYDRMGCKFAGVLIASLSSA